MMWIMIAAGLLLLIVGGEILVRGSVALARRIGVSDLFIGAVLVGFGTSAPELVASLNAVAADSPAIAVGNVIGSNVANLLLVLGTAAVIFPIVTNPKALARDGFIMAGATLILCGLIYFNGFSFVFPLSNGVAIPIAGPLLVTALVCVIIYSFIKDRAATSENSAAQVHKEEAEFIATPMPLIAALPLALSGLVAIVFGADMLIDGCLQLAKTVPWLSEAVVGITVVAIGTSLPELVTCTIAALRQKPDVALGNVLGSNTFNVLGILGITSTVMPFNVPMDQIFIGRDVGALILSLLFLLLFAYTGRKLARWEGAVLLAGYVTYMVLLLR